MNNWRFATSFDDQRSIALLNAPSFGAISDRVARQMTVLCRHSQQCHDHCEFSRVVFCVCIDDSLFDLFFNSPNGYRGAYYRSPYLGLESNESFIRLLAPRLLDWAGPQGQGWDSTFAKESLHSPSAKVWLAECETHLCNKCRGEWNAPKGITAEILNDRWEIDASGNAKFGRLAPLHSKLRVFGAFLNKHHDVLIPERKRHREMDIHKFGWS